MTLRRFVSIGMLTFAWCALWGSVGVANVASGVLVSTAVTARSVGTAGLGRIRFRPLVKIAGIVLIDLVQSTVAVAREILTPTDHTDEAIVRVGLPVEARSHLLLMILAVTVTPGTAVVDADPDTGTLYLHLLHAERRSTTEEHVRRLAELASAALPIDIEAAPRRVRSVR